MAHKKAQCNEPGQNNLYTIPNNWKWVQLSTILQVSKERTEDFTNEAIRYIGLENMEAGKGITSIASASEVRSTKNVFHPGQILYGKLRPYLNKHDVASFDGVCSTDILVFDVLHSIPQKLINVFFDQTSFIEYAVANSKGINLPRTSGETILKAFFPLPPLPEQQRIVDRIESLFAKLDEAKEKAQAVVDSYEERKTAILHKAFSGELTAKWRKENGVSLQLWSMQCLRNCGKWSGGGTPSMSHTEYWENGDILWITSKDMKADIIEDTLMHVSRIGIENSSANYIDMPSVLFVMRSGILRRTLPVAMVNVPFTVNQDLKVVSPTNINVEYLFWACKCFSRSILDTCMKNGTTVESINTNALMAYKVPVAPIEEQLAIVQFINAMIKKEQQAEEAAENVISQIDTMKKAILARAFRGELGTNDPNEEPMAL